MARTQSKDYPEIRQNILRSAAKLFAEKGFSSTTIVDLAQACQSSRGALYHYFTSKEEILTRIITEHVEAMLVSLHDIGEERLEPEAHLRAIARKIMELNAVNNAEQIVLLNDWNQLDDGTRASVGAAQRKIISIVRDAMTRVDSAHRMTPKYATTYAMSLLGSLNYTYAWYDPNGPVTPQDYADRVIDVFMSGFPAKA
ncbi:TetR/AcrR family transcriptional regulator [Seohaeicola zhoushanensis]|uniref:TetR family transcriptional regulator n=1 Tax=Seohaeicola zhoushanensis TaxID=1569283 RepID=A0A8J3MB26_9RHOB|nr:TetR/AcrR family transcriptional regulator [Seohaeicola zhoushanensis]GHF61936.1 TetR family transcriptional regulator [Seohaeicola zhoushanensis]